MKKFLTIVAIAGTLAACNNNSEGTTETESTTTVDSATMMSPTMSDTTGAATMGVDTMQNGTNMMNGTVDSTK